MVQRIESININEIIKDALIKSSNTLPTNKKTTVCVFPSINPNAVSGVVARAGKIIIRYNIYYNEELLQTVTAHEYHHSFWTEKHLTKNSPQTILSNMIFEGKAVMFEKLLYPDSASTTKVNYSYNNAHWSKIEPDLYKNDSNRSHEILFGGENPPANYGYSEGFKMVKSYLDSHPKCNTGRMDSIECQGNISGRQLC